MYAKHFNSNAIYIIQDTSQPAHNLHFWVPGDNSPASAAEKFFNMFGSRCESMQGGYAEAFIKGNPQALFAHPSMDNSGLAYLYQLDNQGKLIVNKQKSGQKEFTQIYADNCELFVNEHLNQGKEYEVCRFSLLNSEQIIMSYIDAVTYIKKLYSQAVEFELMQQYNRVSTIKREIEYLMVQITGIDNKSTIH